MITVAIMSYHYGHLVAQAIESVLSQTLQPARIVVIDDGVGDVQPRYAPRVEYILRPQNMGILAGFNDVLFNVASTDYLMLLGADNWLRPDALERMWDAARFGMHIISSNVYLFGPGAKAFAERWWPYLVSFKDGHLCLSYNPKLERMDEQNYIHGSALYNVPLARSVGGYADSLDGKTGMAEDWVLWRKMLRAGAKHFHVQEPLLYYRQHAANFHQNGVRPADSKGV